MADSFAAWCGHLPQAAAAWCGQVLGYPEELAADPVSFTVRVGPFVAAALILIVPVWKRRRAPATAARENQPPHRHDLPSPLQACRGAFVGIGLITAVLNVLYLTGSFFMLEVYDRVLPSRSVPTLSASPCWSAASICLPGQSSTSCAGASWCASAARSTSAF